MHQFNKDNDNQKKFMHLNGLKNPTKAQNAFVTDDIAP